MPTAESVAVSARVTLIVYAFLSCRTRLDVLETQSGGRIIAIAILGPSVEHTAEALETFQRADAGPHIVCPACRHQFDPSGPYRAIPPLNPVRSR